MDPVIAGAITYGMSSAQVVAMAWLIYELQKMRSQFDKSDERLRKVEISVARIAGRLNVETE